MRALKEHLQPFERIAEINRDALRARPNKRLCAQLMLVNGASLKKHPEWVLLPDERSRGRKTFDRLTGRYQKEKLNVIIEWCGPTPGVSYLDVRAWVRSDQFSAWLWMLHARH